jgi:coenzyme F420 hydrogenase subunit beta
MPEKEQRRPWHIAADGLCVRCGACLKMCPLDLIKSDDHLFPHIPSANLDHCTDCGLCMRPCPADVDFPALSTSLFGRATDPHDAVGVLREVYVGHATDPQFRAAGASGGVGTGLLAHLLCTGAAEQVLVCGMDRQRPWLPRPFLAVTLDEIMAAAQSKYTIVPQMQDLGPITKCKKKTALVGLPCHLHALRKLEAWRPALTENIVMAIGLACHSTLERDATLKLLQVHGIRPENVARLEYRGGERWPRGVRITLTNGEVHRVRALDIKATFNYLKCFYSPARCLLCTDYSAELSDLTLADPWIRDASGNHPYKEGWSLILTRTARGQALIDKAREDGALHVETIDRALLASQFDPVVRTKKKGAFIRIARRRARGRPVPDYGFNLPTPNAHERRSEFLASLLRLPGRWAWSRDLGMRIAFSRTGDWLMRKRTEQKIRRAAQSG